MLPNDFIDKHKQIQKQSSFKRQWDFQEYQLLRGRFSPLTPNVILVNNQIKHYKIMSPYPCLYSYLITETIKLPNWIITLGIHSIIWFRCFRETLITLCLFCMQEEVIAKLIDFLLIPHITTSELLSEKEEVCHFNQTLIL